MKRINSIALVLTMLSSMAGIAVDITKFSQDIQEWIAWAEIEGVSVGKLIGKLYTGEITEADFCKRMSAFRRYRKEIKCLCCESQVLDGTYTFHQIERNYAESKCDKAIKSCDVKKFEKWGNERVKLEKWCFQRLSKKSKSIFGDSYLLYKKFAGCSDKYKCKEMLRVANSFCIKFDGFLQAAIDKRDTSRVKMVLDEYIDLFTINQLKKSERRAMRSVDLNCETYKETYKEDKKCKQAKKVHSILVAALSCAEKKSVENKKLSRAFISRPRF